jgi:TPR repeat protein
VARRPKTAPEPTALHLDFIRASEEEAEARSSAQRKQLEAIAAAQAERETALHEAEEALKEAADAQRKRARIRNIALVVVSILAVLAGLLFWNAEQHRRAAEEQREQADHILAGATKIMRKLAPQMDGDTMKEVFAVFQTGVEHGDATSMYNLGQLYENGFGVEQDYAKAREWYEKAAAKDNTSAMFDLGWFYDSGEVVEQDYAKAREWYEKAANKGDASAMGNLGGLYYTGHGVAQDYAKAREWFEKAANKGDATGTAYLETLRIRKAAKAGRYAEALQLQEALAAKREAVETKREGKPGEETAGRLQLVAWGALFAREFMKALTASDRAHALLPDDLGIESNRAHALMFLGHEEDSKVLYLTHKGKPIPGHDGKLWERAIAEDFAEFRKAGLTHPMMADIEKELGVSP